MSPEGRRRAPAHRVNARYANAAQNVPIVIVLSKVSVLAVGPEPFLSTAKWPSDRRLAPIGVELHLLISARDKQMFLRLPQVFATATRQTRIEVFGICACGSTHSRPYLFGQA